MATKWPPIKNVAYTFAVSLRQQADTKLIKTTPTIAAGDFKVSTDGGAIANPATLPSESPAGSGRVLITLSAAEMNGDDIWVRALDAAGAEWGDAEWSIHTVDQLFNDLPTAAEIADAVLDELLAGHVVAGSLGERAGRIPNVAAGASGGLPLVIDASGRVSANVEEWLGDAVDSLVSGTVPATIDGLGAQAKLDVNAEVLDVLNVDTFTQPGQGAPAATTTIRLMIAYLYKIARNRKRQTATEWDLYNDDAATIDQKATVSDDGSEAVKGELASGP